MRVPGDAVHGERRPACGGWVVRPRRGTRACRHASLTGQEMYTDPLPPVIHGTTLGAVSYTHLTLPTIYSV